MQQPEELTLKKKKKKSSFTGFPSPNPERDKGNPMEPEEARRASVGRYLHLYRLPPFLTAGIQPEGGQREDRAEALTLKFSQFNCCSTFPSDTKPCYD